MSPQRPHAGPDGLHAIARSARDLLGAWRAEADLAELRGADSTARAIRSLANDLEAVLGRQDTEVLTLREASDETGYSHDHLGRLVRNGKIPNAGRPGAPRIRRQDLPRKAGTLPGLDQGRTLRSKAAIVRSIADRGG